MIARAASLFLLVYALGFVFFAFTLGRPAAANARPTDAAVVLTGASGRIEHGVDVVREGQAKRLLVAGADPLVRKVDLARRIPSGASIIQCCVDLGSESVDTRTNAEEALVTDGVRTEPTFLTLFGEYNKYVLRRIAVWVDL
jgi:hypothetical protein